MRARRVLPRLLGCCVLALGLAGPRPAVAAVPDAATIQVQMRASVIDPEGAVAISGFKFDAGLATIHLASGVLVPAMAVGERPVEVVFLGSGRIELEPKDDIERGQLELFTGSERLSESFERAVFVMALGQAVDSALDPARRVPLNRASRLAAEETLRVWRDGPERKLLDTDARVFAAALGDPLAGSFFCGSFDGSTLGRFMYVVDPLADEQVTLGQFVASELEGERRREVQRRLFHARKQGKLIGVDLDDIGSWNPWVSCALMDEAGEPRPGTPGVEPAHYEIDVSLRERDLVMVGTARLHLDVLVPDLRVAILKMHPDLALRQVASGDGRSLQFLRTQRELAVALAEPAGPERPIVVEVEYEARLFERVEARSFSLRQPLDWHPRAGEMDRATYDVTVHWPQQLGLVGNGRVVEQGVSDDGMRWQRRRLDLRCTGLSFEVGDFELLERQVGHVAITVAIDRQGTRIADDLENDIFETIQDALAYFEQVFGPYPLDTLVVVTSPRPYSQGLMGFITLSTSAMMELGEWGAVLGIQDRRPVIAHEMAHQWWGNLVGWQSYRDQWISEAMANYAALLYTRHRLQGPGEARVWRGPTTGWTSWLLADTAKGRPVESLGPVVLGTRLRAAHSLRAYEAIVYKKGAVIFDMLAHLFSEDDFVAILRRVVEAAAHRSISTAQFLSLVERASGTDLGWFARQYVYGTGLPEVSYTYEITERPGGGWVVTGLCTQRSPHHFKHRIVRRGDGRLDMQRTAVFELDVSRSVLVVPFDVGVVTAGDREPSAAAGHQVMQGRLVIRGPETPFSIEVEQQPEVLWFDRRHDVFGRFFCQVCWPKQTLRAEGLHLLAEGRLDEAEQTLRAALDEPFAALPESWTNGDDMSWRARIVDIQVRLALARLHLDRDELDAAGAELDAVIQQMTRGDRWQLETDLVALRARLALRRSRSVAARELLQETLEARRSARSGEAYALLAIAAFETGEDELLDESLAEARRRGVDVAELEAAMAERE